jgi:hypothetical protein
MGTGNERFFHTHAIIIFRDPLALKIQMLQNQ